LSENGHSNRFGRPGGHRLASAAASGEDGRMCVPALAPPRKVFLFSGHMIDAPGRPAPRFPPAAEGRATRAIAAALARLEAGTADLAVCGGACGGDLLFAEAALDRRATLELYLPFEQDEFMAASVDFAGAGWHERFLAAARAATVHLMPRERPPLASGQDPYAQANLWMIEAATRFGPGRVEFLCLWDGQGGDGPGGTAHMIDTLERRAAHVHRLDAGVLAGT
jgi:hypothetical protein